MNKNMKDLHRSQAELEVGIAHILASPKNGGKLALIVARPTVDQRTQPPSGKLSTEEGLAGDNWKARGFRRTPDGSAHPDMQLNIMNSRCAELVAGSKDRWSLAGDQLFVDMDLSEDNLPPGTKLSLGNAIIEVTAEPHLGCRKFSDRYGKDATLFVNSDIGKSAHFRGICAKVVQTGEISLGDELIKV